MKTAEATNQDSPLLVIDKSFTNSVTGLELTHIAQNWTLIAPNGFFFEVLTTEEKSRLSSVRGLPDIRRIHLPTLLARERTEGMPVTTCNAPPVNFNPSLAQVGWTGSDLVSDLCGRYEQETIQPMIELWKVTMLSGKVPGFDDQEIASIRRSQAAFHETCCSLGKRSRVLKIAQAMGEEMINKISESWITYRRIQAWALQALVLLRPNDPNAKSPTDVDLEHDTLDNEYLILALHAGALATMESRHNVGKMGWRFRILRNDGVLVNRDGSTSQT